MRSPFFCLLLGVAAILEVGCLRTSPSLDPSFSLGPPLQWEKSPAFRRAIRLEPSTALERARIDYLLERISKSPYNFLRNGGRYTGKQAGNHFRWKYFTNRGRVKTAEEFIDRVATRSKRSGRPYQVQFPEKRRYPLQALLLQELNFFDQTLEKKRKLLSKTPKEAP